MENNGRLHLEIPILLPEVENERDQCVARLEEELQQRKGIQRVHVEEENHHARLCIHYDPDLLAISQVQRWAEHAGAQLTRRYRHERFHVTDMDCGDCALSIEHILRRQGGVLDVSASYAAEKVWVEYDTGVLDHTDIVRRIGEMGYTVEERRKRDNWLREHWELLLSLLAGVFLAVGFFGGLFFGLPEPVAMVLFILAYIAGGYDATLHGIMAALHARFEIDFLMVVAAIGAAVLGQWADGALLLFLFSLGHALEHTALDRARHAIEALGEITPKSARVQRDGREIELPVEELLRGDRVIVRPGERVPIDGQVLEGHSLVDQSPITGESVPVEKAPGEAVFAGSVNGENGLDIEVTRLAKDSTLARVLQLVEEAQAQKSPTQQFTDRVERIFVPLILAGTVLVIAVPPLVGLLPWQVSLIRGLTILVAASPCALAIATPSAVLSGIAQAARSGVLIKGGAHLENLGRLNAIAFDKTGTITYGRPQVTDLIVLDGAAPRQLLRTAAAVEGRSTHPLAQALVQKAQEEGLDDLPQAGELQSLTGRGVRSSLDGRTVRIGSLKLFEAEGQPVPQEIVERVQALEAQGKTSMLVQDGEGFLGIIGLADRPRSAAAGVFERLRSMGVDSLIMLTGDNPRVAASIAQEVGLSDYRAGLLPEEKVDALKELLAGHGQVAMVGDGVNDAPALAVSSVGIAMGASASDVALETADIALMSDDLARLPFAVGLSRQSRRIIRQNLVISLGVISLLVPAALFGLAGIGIAIVLHEGSTLLVVLNALRLLGYRE